MKHFLSVMVFAIALTVTFSPVTAAQTNLTAKPVLVTEQQLSMLSKQDYQVVIDNMLILDVDTIDSTLQTYTLIQQTWLRHLLITRLKQPALPTKTHQAWLLKQADSTHILYSSMTYSGHQQPIAVINVPAQAKALLAHRHSLNIADAWIEQFEWPQVIEQLATLKRPTIALQRLFSQMSSAQILSISHQLLSQQTEFTVTPMLLGQLAEQIDDFAVKRQLVSWIWTLPTDQYSIAAVRAIATYDHHETAISLLKQATKNEQLASMSLIALANNYNDNPAVIDYLFSQLSVSKHSASAAVALTTVNTSQINKRLEQGLVSPDNNIRKASAYAMKLQANQ